MNALLGSDRAVTDANTTCEYYSGLDECIGDFAIFGKSL